MNFINGSFDFSVGENWDTVDDGSLSVEVTEFTESLDFSMDYLGVLVLLFGVGFIIKSILR